MSPDQMDSDVKDDVDEAAAPDSEAAKRNLQVEIDSPSACERHVTVTVSRGDIQRNDAHSRRARISARPRAPQVGRRPLSERSC